MNLKNKKVLITGATGGIGNSLVEIFLIVEVLSQNLALLYIRFLIVIRGKCLDRNSLHGRRFVCMFVRSSYLHLFVSLSMSPKSHPLLDI